MLDWRALKRSGNDDWPSIFDLEQGRYLASEAAALSAALDLIDAGPGTPLLIPSIPGPGLLNLLRAREVTALFYRLGGDFSPDLDHAQRLMRFKPRAILAGHPFGLAVPLAATASFAREQGLRFIEDCTEALWGFARTITRDEEGGLTDTRLAMGTQGELCIAAPARHLPGWSAGILASAHREQALPEPPATPLTSDLGMTAGALKDVLGRVLDPHRPARDAEATLCADIKPAPRGTRTWYQMLDHVHCIEQRRAHYHRLSLEVSGTGVFTPIVPDLPEGAVPTLYPVDSPERDRVHAILQDSGIPATNLRDRIPDELQHGVCERADTLRTHGLGLPCHQSLRPGQMDRQVAQLLRFQLP